MIPMTMRAIMAPEPETDGEERAAVALIACSSAIPSNLHVTFHRFPRCTVYLTCAVGVRSSLATKSLTSKQSVTATALETKLITLKRVDGYKPWLKSLCFTGTKLNTWTRIRCATTLTLDEDLFFGLCDSRGVRGYCRAAHRWGGGGLHLWQSPAHEDEAGTNVKCENSRASYMGWKDKKKNNCCRQQKSGFNAGSWGTGLKANAVTV